MGPQPFLLAAVTPVDVDWPRPAPLPCAINPCAARPAGWLGEPPPSAPQTARVPAGPRSAAARVGVSPAGRLPALPAQSGFVGPAGGWLGARRRVENLVSSGREGERRAAPPPLPGPWRLPQPSPTSLPSPSACTLPPPPSLRIPKPTSRPRPPPVLSRPSRNP